MDQAQLLAQSRLRRKSAKYKGVKYNNTVEFSDDYDSDEQNATTRKIIPCMSSRNDYTGLSVDSFVGRRINEISGEMEYRIKFVGRSYIHLAWLTYDEVSPIIGGNYRDRMRVQQYERKLKREGYGFMEDADDLPISCTTIDCVLSHKQARLPTLKESLLPYQQKWVVPKCPQMTHVFLFQHQGQTYERMEGVVNRLISEVIAEPFRDPLDVESIPDYLEIISTPLDLGTIAGRLHRREYYIGGSAHCLLQADVKMVFTNCMTYNQEGSEIYKAAEELLAMFVKHMYEWILTPSAWLPSLQYWEPWTPGCSICNTNKEDVDTILCDKCDGEYHMTCLVPPLKNIPQEEWFCPDCIKRSKFDDKTEHSKMKALSGILQSHGDLGVHELPESKYPKVLWEYPVQAKADKLTSSAGVPIKKKEQSTIGAQFETVYLAKWQGMSHQFCTWERFPDIADKELIRNYERFNAMPSDYELKKTVCQLECCAQVMTLDGGYGSNACQKDKFCTLGYFHSGECSREMAVAASGSYEYTRQRMIDQIRAQLYAYHRIMNNKKVSDNLLKKCGMHTIGHSLRRKYFPKQQKAADEYDDEDDESDDDSETLSETEQPINQFPFPFRAPVTQTANEDDDEDDEEEEGDDEDEVCNVVGAIVEHLAFAKELPSLIPQKVMVAKSCEYNALIRKSQYGLGMRLGLAEDGMVRVVGFQRQPNGTVGPAEATRLIIDGDIISRVNQKNVLGMPFQQIIQQIGVSPNFVLITFRTDRPARSFPKFSEAKDIFAGSTSQKNNYIPYPYPINDYSPLRVGHHVAPAEMNRIRGPQVLARIQSMGPNGPLQHLYSAVCDNSVDILEHFRAFLPLSVCLALDKAKQLKLEEARKGDADDVEVTDEFVPYEKSPTFKGSRALREYQVEGLNWMITCWHARRSSILADEMGLGKTVQVVSFIEHLRTEENIRGPYLVVVPLSTLQHWRREIEDWTDMNVCVYHDVGDSRSRSTAKEMRAFIRQMEWYYERRTRGLLKFNILLTTYETLLSDYEEFEPIHWRLLVVDEAHRLKSSHSKALKRMRALHIDRRLLLTGTPLQNNLTELWVLLNFLEPSQFDSFDDFNGSFGKLQSQEQVVELQKKIAPFILRRVKEDVEKSIPPKEETIIEVELTRVQKQYYRAIYERNRSYLYMGVSGGLPSLINIQMQLRKCCNHPFLIKGVEDREVEGLTQEEALEKMLHASGKYLLLSKLLPKLKREGHKVLVFSQFLKQLDLMQRYCESQSFGCERLDGAIQGHERQMSIDRFSRSTSKCFVFLLSTRAGGVGINLIAADTVIILDSDWNPQNDLQAQARCHRIGQEKAVKVYRLISRNTFESEMFARASRKLGLEHAILGTASFNETSLLDDQPSAQELEDLLKRGAYGLADDDDSAFRNFAERDIEDILKENAHVLKIDSTDSKVLAGGKSIDRSSFVAEKGSRDLLVDDPNFWEKVLPGDMTVEMLALKLRDGSATESRQSRAKFIRNLQVATENILNNETQGKAPDSRISEFDISMQLWQKVVSKKKGFSEEHKKQAHDTMEIMHSGRVRSCRVDRVANNTESIDDTPAKTKRKRRTSKTPGTGGRPAKAKKTSYAKTDDLCALCGDGGLILLCDGPCHRSFHLECIGVTSEPAEEAWFCPDCEAGKHTCLKCGKIGQVGVADGVVQCSEGKCGRFYHRACLRNDKTVSWVGRKRFQCPQHTCEVCVTDDLSTKTRKRKKGAAQAKADDSKKGELLRCIYCPMAIHAACATKEGKSVHRLSPSLIICSKHGSTPVGKRKFIASTTKADASDEFDESESSESDDDSNGKSKITDCALCKSVDRELYTIDGVDDVEGALLDEVIVVAGQRYRVHINCAIRSPEVYVNSSGKFCNLSQAIKRGKLVPCSLCKRRGGTIGCVLEECDRSYHLRCGLSEGGNFLQDKDKNDVFYCKYHVGDAGKTNPKQCICNAESDDDALNLNCVECPKKFHAACVGVPIKSQRAKNWTCDTCNSMGENEAASENGISSPNVKYVMDTNEDDEIDSPTRKTIRVSLVSTAFLKEE